MTNTNYIQNGILKLKQKQNKYLLHVLDQGKTPTICEDVEHLKLVYWDSKIVQQLWKTASL